MVEGCRFTGVTRLTVVILARQSTSMTISTGQGGICYPDHIMMLSFGRTGTTGSRPESIIMTGCTRLRCQGVVTGVTIGNAASTENHVMVLTHCGTTTVSSPEG